MSSSTVVTERRPNFVENGQQVRREEAVRSRASDDVFHAQRQQGQQNDNRFLFEPESTRDSGRSFTPQPSFSAVVTADDGRVCIVTLTCIDQTRQAFDITELQFVETVFTARRGQDQAVVRHAGGEVGEVVTFATRAITTANQKM